jgi:hypothetical protein
MNLRGENADRSMATRCKAPATLAVVVALLAGSHYLIRANRPGSMTAVYFAWYPWEPPLHLLACALAAIACGCLGVSLLGRIAGSGLAIVASLSYAAFISSYAYILPAVGIGILVSAFLALGATTRFWLRAAPLTVMAFGGGWLAAGAVWDWGWARPLLQAAFGISAFAALVFAARWLFRQNPDRTPYTRWQRLFGGFGVAWIVLVALWYGYAANHWLRLVRIRGSVFAKGGWRWLTTDRIDGIRNKNWPVPILDVALAALRGGWWIRRVEIKHSERLHELTAFPDTEEFSIVNVHVTRAGLASIRGQNPRELRLRQCSIDDDAFGALAGKSLYFLKCQGCSMNDRALASLSAAKIELLSLRACGLHRIDLAAMPVVSQIDLAGNPITDEDLATSRFPAIWNHMDLTRTLIRGPGLAYLPAPSATGWLTLESTPLDDEGLKHLPKFPLTMLILSDTKVTVACIPDLATRPIQYADLGKLQIRRSDFPPITFGRVIGQGPAGQISFGPFNGQVDEP